MRFQSICILTALFLVAWTPVGSGQAQLMASPPSTPMAPNQTFPVLFALDVPCDAELAVEGSRVFILDLAATPDEVLVASSTTTEVAGDACRTDPRGRVHHEFSLDFMLTENAPGLEPITVKAFARAGGDGSPVPASDPPANARFTLVADYLSDLAVHMDRKLLSAGHEPVVKVANFGNAQSRVNVSLVKSSLPGLTLTAESVILDRVGGDHSEAEIPITLNMPKTGWDELAITMTVTDSHALNETKQGEPSLLSIVVRNSAWASIATPGAFILTALGILVVAAGGYWYKRRF